MSEYKGVLMQKPHFIKSATAREEQQTLPGIGLTARCTDPKQPREASEALSQQAPACIFSPRVCGYPGPLWLTGRLSGAGEIFWVI